MRGRQYFALILLPLIVLPSQVAAQKAQDGTTFFEAKIRPVLVEHCYSCHSSQAQAQRKLKGGLKLDSRAGLLEGGDSGPALTPGEPGESLLLETLRYDDLVRMPPKGKLDDRVIADFETWIKQGAPDPRTAATPPTSDRDTERSQPHWAYQPPIAAALPVIRERSWPRDPIDAFILARLEVEALRPATEADRATLARRLTFDLIGLPPTPAEIDAFTRDDAPDAYERLVDRLLASPRFGERWGRHWLDVVRFAESLTLRGFVFPDAWRYRDLVIESFQTDRPFDRFVRDQVAGDLVPADTLTEHRQGLIATTFLTLGNTNLEEQDKAQLRMDVVDEQLDTIGKGILAQTIGCARCHDHKFDPIPTRDYYALAGILRNTKSLEHANVSKWIDRSLPAEPAVEAVLKDKEAAIATLETRLKQARARGATGARSGPLSIAELPGIVVDDTQARKVGTWQESQSHQSYIGNGYLHDRNEGKGEKTLTFQPEIPTAGKYEVRLAYAPGTNRARAVPITIFSADGEFDVSVDMRADPPIDGRFVSLGQYAFEANGQGYILVATGDTTGHVTADAVQFLPTGAIASGKTSARQTTAHQDAEVPRLEAELKRLKATGPRRETVMSVVEEATITDSPIHIRGSVQHLGEIVPRGFLTSVPSGSPPTLPAHQSGRLELADWLTNPANPLTARVMVNRVWHWLFGAGIIATTDNFGTTGEPPSHPELLDRLALDFVRDGWSVKRLVRRVVLSSTYRQASTIDPRAAAVDPRNRWLSHSNRRRLDAECLRDAMLEVTGQLRQEMGGPGFPSGLASDYGFAEPSTRRSVYSPAFRNALPELFEVFDFADPSLVSGQRHVSTVSPQALYLMNHPFVIEQSRAAARRLLDEDFGDDDDRIDRAYRRALGRQPTEPERAIAHRFLSSGADPCESWDLLFQALFGSIDFRYVD